MSSVIKNVSGYKSSVLYLPYQLTNPYTEAISETYKLISADYWNQNPNTDNTVVFYANSIIMVDDNWQPYSTNLDTKISGAENLLTPNLVLMPNLGGFTGPGSGMNNFLQYLNIGGVFKLGMSNYMGSGVSTDNAAAITLIHEIAHSWGQNQMAYKWNSTNVSDAEIHNHFCTGYNKDLCVFRYESTDKLKSNYAEHNKKGVIWCESHKQILMNQLMRKFYAQ